MAAIEILLICLGIGSLSSNRRDKLKCQGRYDRRLVTNCVVTAKLIFVLRRWETLQPINPGECARFVSMRFQKLPSSSKCH